MFRFLLLALFLLLPASAQAGVINVEFHFVPFVGDPKNDAVETVPGRAEIYLNGILLAGQDIEKQEVPVMFDSRDISAPIWIPMHGYGSLVRKGKNMLRIEFKPTDAKKKYRAQLRWASVMDETTETTTDGGSSSTNMAGEGRDDQKANGPITFEREFMADFAADHAWHHYPPIAELTDADRKALTALAAARIDAFKPDFSALYALLKGNENIKIPEVKKSGCLARAYKAGLRLALPPADKLQILTTGQAAVVIQSTEGQLYLPADPSVLEKITDEDDQMCIGIVIGAAYPSRLVIVRTPKGAWEIID